MTERSVIEAEAGLLRPQDAAERLAISARYLRLLTARGEIAAVKFGRSVRYRLQDVQSLIERSVTLRPAQTMEA